MQNAIIDLVSRSLQFTRIHSNWCHHLPIQASREGSDCAGKGGGHCFRRVSASREGSDCTGQRWWSLFQACVSKSGRE